MNFSDGGTEDIYNGRDTRFARKRLPAGPDNKQWESARRKLDRLKHAVRLDELRVPPGNRLKTLHGDLRGYFSIRINDQYRIVFRWTESGATDVRIADYHD